MVRRGTLKAEARTIQYLLTHRYKNPYCESCIRAKMRHYKAHRGAFKRKLKAFGDLVIPLTSSTLKESWIKSSTPTERYL